MHPLCTPKRLCTITDLPVLSHTSLCTPVFPHTLLHPQSSPCRLSRAPSSRCTWIGEETEGWDGAGPAWAGPPCAQHVPPTQVDVSGVVLELPQGGCPWKEHVFSLEQELALPDPLQLVLFPDHSGQWRVQSVPVGPHTFQSR